jgi:hypothetical protein
VELHKGEAEREGHQLCVQAAHQGDQEHVDHGHHPGLLQESVQLHAQEDPAGGKCQEKGHQALKICKNM